MTNHEETRRNSDQEEIDRKRKNNGTNNNNNGPDYQISKKINRNHDDEDNDMLSLSLSLCPARPVRDIPEQQSSPLPSLSTQEPLSAVQTLMLSQTLPQLPQPQRSLELSPTRAMYLPSFMGEVPVYRQEPVLVSGPARPLRLRRNPTQAPGEGKGDTVPALYPWATTQRATVHSLNYLISKNITTITGEVQCKKCEKQYEMGYDLSAKFIEVGRFIAENKSSMHDRAPNVWMNPVLPTCKFCKQENSSKPVITLKKKQINWLFLLLGQLLGCCTLDQLKYFCKHTKNHRTGAKDRVLYLTYLGLCKQLDPNGPFDR